MTPGSVMSAVVLMLVGLLSREYFFCFRCDGRVKPLHQPGSEPNNFVVPRGKTVNVNGQNLVVTILGTALA